MKKFQHLGNPHLIFGSGKIAGLVDLLPVGATVLVVSGEHFSRSRPWKDLEGRFESAGVDYSRETVSGEPSPEVVDDLTSTAKERGVDAVVAIGGGSVIDAGKAVAAMIKHPGSVVRYLEGVGDTEPTGDTVPMIAAPTTAGTGSEATKNSSLSRRGIDGFKKSLRHDRFIPSVALVDPQLAVGCPPEVSLSCGMDAFCQILESYVSTGATPVTDALAGAGLVHFGHGSRLFAENQYGGPEELKAREHLALAAYYSGLTLANAGLGTVHGLAGPLGAYCEVPHGVACGLLLAPVFRLLVEKLGDSEDDRQVRRRLETAGAALLRGEGADGEASDVDFLLERFESWAQELPGLSKFGLKDEDLDRVVAASSNKYFPVALDETERRSVLKSIL